MLPRYENGTYRDKRYIKRHLSRPELYWRACAMTRPPSSPREFEDKFRWATVVPWLRRLPIDFAPSIVILLLSLQPKLGLVHGLILMLRLQLQVQGRGRVRISGRINKSGLGLG